MNKVIVLVGATSMIGQACARILAEKETLILLARNTEKLEDLKKRGNSVEAYPVDITSQQKIESILDKVLKTHGRIDAMVYKYTSQ
ncbi:MAG: SDR family NAD(P)-dependent oxidoreductase [Proteobacteria bacterium]|nr:SDR family NAD(P)-dependent oxidoreductase [Pseudomonadota bacterium]